MNRSELNHIRTTLTGTRSLLAAYFYGTFEMVHLQRVLTDAKVDIFLNHECGGVMDHLANIIEALDQAIGEPEPGDREPFFPAPDTQDEVGYCADCGSIECTPACPNRMRVAKADSACPHCGGSMLGDGYTTVMHCERVDLSSVCAEPDSAPIFCDPND
jgi:hypothetical protein